MSSTLQEITRHCIDFVFIQLNVGNALTELFLTAELTNTLSLDSSFLFFSFHTFPFLVLECDANSWASKRTIHPR
jgi:hypothetical protein